MGRSIIGIDKNVIDEELLYMSIDPNEVHDVSDFYRLFNIFLCNLLDYMYVDFHYLKCKLEFSDDELRCSSDNKHEIITLVPRSTLLMYELEIYVYNDEDMYELCFY